MEQQPNNQQDPNLRPVRRRRKVKHPILKIVLMLVLTAAFAGGAYAFKLWNDTVDAADSIYNPLKDKKVSTNIKDAKPISILLMGLDNGAEGRKDAGHSDTMIVATVNAQTKQTTLTSIPRDTVAQLQGNIPEDTLEIQKINAAYAVGGADMAVSTVEKLLNIPLDYYVTVDMGALVKIVDAVGGIEIDAPFAFFYDNRGFVKGKQKIDGAGALSYARMRYDDPDGDYGRQKRQQQVITALIKQAVSYKTLANFQTVLDTIKEDISTNLTFDNMMAIQQSYRAAAGTINKDTLKGTEAIIGDGDYQVAHTKELRRVSNAIRSQLGLSAETLNNEEIRQNGLNPDYTGELYHQNYYIYPTESESDS